MFMTKLLDPEDSIPDEIRHTWFIHAARQECYEVLTTAEGWSSWSMEFVIN
jgi:hypothetical protein